MEEGERTNQMDIVIVTTINYVVVEWERLTGARVRRGRSNRGARIAQKEVVARAPWKWMKKLANFFLCSAIGGCTIKNELSIKFKLY